MRKFGDFFGANLSVSVDHENQDSKNQHTNDRPNNFFYTLNNDCLIPIPYLLKTIIHKISSYTVSSLKPQTRDIEKLFKKNYWSRLNKSEINHWIIPAMSFHYLILGTRRPRPAHSVSQVAANHVFQFISIKNTRVNNKIFLKNNIFSSKLVLKCKKK